MNERDAPTPEAHIRHFLSTVEDYERLAALFPIGDSINILGLGDDDERRWQIVLHAVMLRKYFQKDDRLFLPRVLTSLRQCVIGDDPTEEQWAELIDSVGVQPAGPAVSFVGSKGYNSIDVMENELYGRFLHGDYGKWLHTQTAARIADTQLMSAASALAHRVLRVAQWIRVGVRDGHVSTAEREQAGPDA